MKLLIEELGFGPKKMFVSKFIFSVQQFCNLTGNLVLQFQQVLQMNCKISKNKNFKLESRGEFRTQLNIQDGKSKISRITSRNNYARLKVPF